MILTVIIPIYNVEKYLKKTLNSVLNQKINDFEIILVDDGSTDASLGKCKEWAENYENFATWAKENGYNNDLTLDRIDTYKNYCP